MTYVRFYKLYMTKFFDGDTEYLYVHMYENCDGLLYVYYFTKIEDFFKDI